MKIERKGWVTISPYIAGLEFHEDKPIRDEDGIWMTRQSTVISCGDNNLTDKKAYPAILTVEIEDD